jgi:transposase
MAHKRLSMRKTREILRLSWGLGLSKRKVSHSLKISHSTVLGCLARAGRAGLSWPLPEDLSDSALEGLLYPPTVYGLDRPLPAFDKIYLELKRKGMTLQLLWEEYRENYPDGYRYSQFCELYRRWRKKLDLSMRQEYKAGEKMFVDYAGQTVPIVDRETGAVTQAQVFVACLGASSYTYAEASLSQALPCWISSHVRAFEYFEGVPEIVVPDNVKSGVTRADYYEPDINPSYHDLCLYYATTVIPARVRRPRDKAKAENAVQVVERWILARLRKRTFFSLEEVNEAIGDLLEYLNDRKFKKLDTTRREVYEKLERPALRALPPSRYEYTQWKRAKVFMNYHVEVDKHHYSVPYQLVGEKVEVRYTASTVEVFFKGKRVACHLRSYRKGGYTTLDEHMPASHRAHRGWSPQRIINWAEKTGPCTGKLVQRIMAERPHPEQGYRSCLGIIRLERYYGRERLEAACRKACALRAYSYRRVQSMLKSGMDRVKILPGVDDEQPKEPLVHLNLRGAEYYRSDFSSGGGNA